MISIKSLWMCLKSIALLSGRRWDHRTNSRTRVCWFLGATELMHWCGACVAVQLQSRVKKSYDKLGTPWKAEPLKCVGKLRLWVRTAGKGSKGSHDMSKPTCNYLAVILEVCQQNCQRYPLQYRVHPFLRMNSPAFFWLRPKRPTALCHINRQR